MAGRGHARGGKGLDPLPGPRRKQKTGGPPIVDPPPMVQSVWGQPAPAPAKSAWGPPKAPETRQVTSGNVLPAASLTSDARARGGNGGNGGQQVRGGGPDRVTSTPRNGAGPSGREAGPSGRGAGPTERGSMRGRSVISDIIRTKPENLQTKRGSTGQEVRLITNHFRLLKKPQWQLYQYRVDFSPPIENERFRNGLINKHKPTFGGYLFDGTMLFLTVKLPDEVTEFMDKDNKNNDSSIQIKIKFIGLLSMATASSVQVLNLILRRAMGALDLQLVGRNFFDALAKISIPQYRLELWPGYITSIRQHEVDILLCTEIAHKVMRNETVYDILSNCIQNDRNYRTTFENLIIGMTVLNKHNNKTYKINDIDFDSTPLSTFIYKNEPTSYVAYYMQKYDIAIRDTNQPLLITIATARNLRGGEEQLIVLIPELCTATGLSDRMVGDFRLTQAVAQYTRLTPKSRIERLLTFNKRLQNAPKSVDHLTDWNFQLDKNLIELKGRVLPGEKIILGNNYQVQTNIEADWSREFRNVSMYSMQHLRNWIVIFPRRNGNETQEFTRILQKAAHGMRYEVASPKFFEMPDDRVQTYAITIDKAANANPQLIMIILPNNTVDRYSVIKKKCCVERAIPTQVMLARTITPKPGRDSNSLMTVGTKVVIQLNSKLGGAPWMVNMPLNGCMIVGFDVCHDTMDKNKDKSKRRSYGAMVATMDMTQSRNYFSAVSAHTNGEELCNQFGLNLVKALDNYRTEHKSLPARIMIYRDGVGEGQTNYVIEHEVKSIRAQLDTMYKGAQYKFTFIVVSKRINTRFFKGSENPSPGTVVDDVVTLPERYDFFLVSQSVKQGTVSPTNYNILYDTFGLPPDKLQIFTYKMTHLYYNWTGTLRVPAVCQYAHKLAFLVGNYIHQSPSALLEKQLYFL